MGGSSSSGYPGKYIFLRICSGDFGSVGYISYNVKDPVLLRGLHIIAYVFINALKAMLTITKAIAHSYYTKQYARSQENITEKKKKITEKHIILSA